jgi:serine/threonine protein kinase
MEPPKLKYNEAMYTHIKSTKRTEKSYMMTDLETLGKGAAGTTFTAYLKPRSRFSEALVLKEQKRTRYCENEFEALKLIRDHMLTEKLPGYFIFMYGCFTSGNKKYIIMEKADYSLDKYMLEYNLTVQTYLYTFYHIAQAVSYLEHMNFNHGDLWIENVMMNWGENQDHLPIEYRHFDIKIIDFDSAYMENSSINNPSYGGADSFRNKFILGYDLNRFFDSLIYSYESYIQKKEKHKRLKIAKLKRLRKRDNNITIPSLDDPDSSDEDYDEVNVIYPPEIIELFYRIGPSDPNNFNDCPDMSGKAIMTMVINYTNELGIDLNDVFTVQE